MYFKMWKMMVNIQGRLNIMSQRWDYMMDWLVDHFSESETNKYFQTLETWGWVE